MKTFNKLMLTLCMSVILLAGCNTAKADLNDIHIVKKTGENLYISAKMDSTADILYWFKKCMYNNLYTFYRVGTIANSSTLPTTPDANPETTLNEATSDNIGPFLINGGGWCGGNHAYTNNRTRTAGCMDFKIFLDDKEVTADSISTTARKIRIEATSNIQNPTKPSTNAGGTTILPDTFCIEHATYDIYRNNINVAVSHDYKCSEAVTVTTYYGMQSMFNGETYTLTSEGQYPTWEYEPNVGRFTKGNYPYFRRFIEKNANYYQSSYLLPDGIGDHSQLEASDIIYIGNSSSKSYHKQISNKQRIKGDSDSWAGIYTWFRHPIADNDNMLCYEGNIGGNEVIFIDCKKAIDDTLALPAKYTGRKFTINDNPKDISITESKGSLRVKSNATGSCVLYFGTSGISKTQYQQPFKVIGGKGGISIKGNANKIEVYNIHGSLISKNESNVKCPSGCYIVCVNGTVSKVLVR
jgi:hypothetical protein